MAGLSQRQLPLQVQLRDEATLDNFLAAEATRPLISALQQQLQAAGEAIIYIYGVSGAGKSHLLQASCHLAGSRALYLPLGELGQYSPQDVLHDIHSLDLVCLDDVHLVMENPEWELALFNLCNRARERGCKLLVAGNAAPRALAVDLADLRSRLGWGLVYQLPQLEDDNRAAILRFRAQRRGLQLPAEVAAYIVVRAPRAMEPLLELLDTLDQASLAEQRALSIHFVKHALDW